MRFALFILLFCASLILAGCSKRPTPPINHVVSIDMSTELLKDTNFVAQVRKPMADEEAFDAMRVFPKSETEDKLFESLSDSDKAQVRRADAAWAELFKRIKALPVAPSGFEFLSQTQSGGSTTTVFTNHTKGGTLTYKTGVNNIVMP